MIRKTGILIAITAAALFINIGPAAGKGDTSSRTALKTSHKRYTVFPFKDRQVLCEPYTVAKNDWLYKIFRKKGVISEKDFPLFLAIFQSLNPRVSNIDAITPGQEIMIPLKWIEGNDYQETEPGIVEVPVIEFASMPERLKPYIKKHTVTEGDVVSRLIDKTYINSDGSLNEKGRLAFRLLNPTVKDPDVITTGSVLNIPSSSLASQSWFTSLLNKTEKPAGEAPGGNSIYASGPIAKQLLNVYARRFKADIFDRGKLFIPRSDDIDLQLDLESSPMIRKPDGSRILFIAPDRNDPLLVKAIQSFWPKLSVMDLKILEKQMEGMDTNPSSDTAGVSDEPVLPAALENAIGKLLEMTSFDYDPDFPLSFSLNGIALEVMVGRISREGKPELIINFGTIYGTAVEAIRKTGREIVSIHPSDNTLDAVTSVFTALDISTVQNPAFVNPENQQTVITPGLYLTGPGTSLFVADQPLKRQIADYLKNNRIRIIYTSSSKTKGV